MGRTILYVFVVIGVGYILVTLATYSRDTAFLAPPQPAAVRQATNTEPLFTPVPTSGAFNETGTLVFYPNNVGPIPYLFYRDESGRTVAKILRFQTRPPADFSSWAGARISVSGEIEAEHVVVTRMSYISPP